MKTVTLDEANEYMDLNIRSAKKTAIATASYVLSPVAFLFLAGLSEYRQHVISENMAGGAGVVVLLLIVGIATAYFVMHGMKLEPYEHLEKECFRLEYGVEGIVREEDDGIRGNLSYLYYGGSLPLYHLRHTAYGSGSSRQPGFRVHDLY